VNNISPSSFLQQEIQRMREYDAGRKDLLMKIQVREEHIVKLNQKIMELQEKIDSTGNNGVI
jgi:peptidoglycan hydrolase CwlO-like protein